MAYYVLDDHNNKIAAFDQEGILAVLQQAIADQSLEDIDPDSAVASKLRSVINDTTHHIEFVTQAQYNTLEQGGELIEGCYYFITDDTTAEDIEDAIDALEDDVDALQTGLNSAEADIAKLKIKSTTTASWNDLKAFFPISNKVPVAVFIRIDQGGDLYYIYQATAVMQEELGETTLSRLVYLDAGGTGHAVSSLGYGTTAIVYYREA